MLKNTNFIYSKIYLLKFSNLIKQKTLLIENKLLLTRKMQEEIVNSVAEIDKTRKLYFEEEHLAKQARDKEEKYVLYFYFIPQIFLLISTNVNKSKNFGTSEF